MGDRPGPNGDQESVEMRLRRRIAAEGSVGVDDYMEAANAYYYASRDPLGADGDFVTAPEISQMFGELVGVWLADLWLGAGRPEGVRYVELGPGRGTLAADALRAMRGAGLTPDVELVETSPVLRRAQAERLAGARWHDDLCTLPDDAPLLVVANEYFDALPIRQFDAGGVELRVRWQDGRFVRDPSATIVERSPAAESAMTGLAARIARQGGAALVIDYGHQAGSGDTLQAVSRHGFADPWQAPGSRDLTAHVDFAVLARAAAAQGIARYGPIPQGAWLEAMGIAVRAAALASASPQRAAEISAARERLVAPEQMGHLFKVLALAAPGWPAPAGFP